MCSATENHIIYYEMCNVYTYSPKMWQKCTPPFEIINYAKTQLAENQLNNEMHTFPLII